MDLLEAIAAFVRVAETESFSRVARDLGVDQSRISKQIARLEARFGVRLLSRTTRRVRLTEEGVAFLPIAQRMLDHLAEAEAELGHARGGPVGLVRIGSPSAFARRHLTASVAGILDAHPGLRIEVVAGDLSENLVEQGLDVAIRFGTVSGDLVARRVGFAARIAVAAPAYLARAGEPLLPHDLRRHQCLVYANPNSGADWLFSSIGVRQQVTVSGRLQSNNAEVIREACLAGMGIALMPLWLFQDELRSGQVRQVLQTFAAQGLEVFVAYPSRRYLPPKVRVVCDALVEDLARVVAQDRPLPRE